MLPWGQPARGAAARTAGQAEDTAANPADTAEADASGQTADDAAVDVSGYSVMMESGYQGDPNGDQREVAKIVCTDADGNVVWQKEVVSQHSSKAVELVRRFVAENERIAGLGGPAIIIGTMLAHNIVRVTGHREIVYCNQSCSR